MPSLALVSTDPEFVGQDDRDLEPLRAALRSHGIDVHVPSWRDTDVDWSSFDLAIMRSPWDYAEHPQQFLDWLDRASAATRLLNLPEVIRWNLDKRYLAELEGRGVRVVDSQFCTSADEVAGALSAVDSPRVVVKPTVSAGSRNTGLFERDDPRAAELARHIIGIGKTAMVQPAVESVSTVGERALVYFDGMFSHALVKGPILDVGGNLLGGVYTESIEPAQATPAERQLADGAMAAISSIFLERGIAADDAVPLYARLDLVETDDGPALLEAELFEPAYFVHTAPASEARFAAAVLARLATPPLR
ncbi:ATP-grasp domain-containing protein [Parafrigoribacterium soli]|uniref:ATP-grasp domain-containing protein n=1 Tax=Parafrigoribacterium soli TaxID=3144663 RepID=UPI0032EDE5BC